MRRGTHPGGREREQELRLEAETAPAGAGARKGPFRCHMDVALNEARAAGGRGEVPVGAAIVSSDGRMLASAGNRIRELSDPTAHAEILVIREACRLMGTERLPGLSLFVTLEPCAMCAAAISHARIARLYYGASDPKSGGIEQGARVFAQDQCHHAPEIYSGIAETESSRLLTEFFDELRRKAP